MTDPSMVTTKGGDGGKSTNFNGECFQKDDVLFDTVGAIDELTSYLGIIKQKYHEERDLLEFIQRCLQKIMSVIATDPEWDLYDPIPRSELYINLDRITYHDTVTLETENKEKLEHIELEPVFVLPGSESLYSAHFDYARAICRRAEREVVRFASKKNRPDLTTEMKFLNRLSDLLFIFARST